jgi:hypothetical protein
VTYTATQADTITFTIEAVRAGRLVHGACRKPGTHSRHLPRCTYLAALGSFTHADIPGTDSFVLTGRLDGRSLPAGSYELVGVPANGNGSGAGTTRKFTIG